MPHGRLGDGSSAPFRYKKGDRVAWLVTRDRPSKEFSGEIIDGWCAYDEGGGALDETYTVQLTSDKSRFFTASGVALTRVKE
jgi:hypothetical protein